MIHSACITGLGFITSIGNDAASVAANLRTGSSGITPHVFSENPALPVKVIAPIRGFSVNTPSYRDWTWPEGPDLPRETVRSMAPHGVYAFHAFEQALADAGLLPSEIKGPETGLFCASAGSSLLLHHHLSQMHATHFERGNPLGVVSSIAGTLNFNLAAHYGITGAVTGFASACTSSTHALGYALDEIRLGRQERMIVVGAEDLNAGTVMPFSSMRALSINPDPVTASRPFDTGRDGFVATGGATVLILESAGLARRRSARVYAELVGWGQAADGYNVSASHPEGAGLREAMLRALRDARVAPAQIDYVNAHATSTPVGDRAEALALRSVFTDSGARPVVSSTKGITGHGLSLAGAMETAFCALGFRAGFIPGNPTLVTPDDACAGLELPRASIHRAPGYVLKNSSGFGGSNVSLILRSGSN